MNGVEISRGQPWTEDEVCNVSRLRYTDGFGIRRHTVVDSTATVHTDRSRKVFSAEFMKIARPWFSTALT